MENGAVFSKSTKVLIYQSLVQSIILYNSETWTIKENQKWKLKTFEMAVLREICGMTGRDRRLNVDILKELQLEKDINKVLWTRRLIYFGHVARDSHGQGQISTYLGAWVHNTHAVWSTQRRAGRITSCCSRSARSSGHRRSRPSAPAHANCGDLSTLWWATGASQHPTLSESRTTTRSLTRKLLEFALIRRMPTRRRIRLHRPAAHCRRFRRWLHPTSSTLLNYCQISSALPIQCQRGC